MCNVDRIIRFENGEMDTEETICLFQDLVNTGLAWQLQGSYGRMAKDLIDAGLVSLPKMKVVVAKTFGGE